jgi:ferritin-like metal-binding protein YciE
MFERLNTPQELYNFKLGAALKMEREVLNILESSIDEAKDEKVAALFRQHHEESRGHIRNLEEVFGLFGWDVDDSPCPAIEGLEKEGKANAKKTDDALVDIVLLQSAVEVEHHEIGAYENLILNARAMGRNDVVSVLERNIQSEQQTLETVKRVQEQMAAVMPKQPV